MSKRIHHDVDFNFAVDNLNNKRYYETQNYVTSRLPGERLDSLPPVGITVQGQTRSPVWTKLQFPVMIS